MVSFLFNILKLLHVFLHGVRESQEFRILFYLLVTLLSGSTLFYSNVEGWSLIDALYFSVMTMSTIGYGDLAPTKDISKLFTIFFAFLSIGVFVSLNAKVVLISLNNKKKTLTKLHSRTKNK